MLAQPPTAGYCPAVPAMRRHRRRTCALDLGRVRVGVAVDDDLGLLAHPRGVLDGRRRGAFLAAVKSLADDEDIGHFVVGLPLDMSGGSGDAARDAARLAQEIADATGRPVDLWDERLSTVQAARNLAASDVHGAKAKGHIDEASACVILQSWLDAHRARRKR